MQKITRKMLAVGMAVAVGTAGAAWWKFGGPKRAGSGSSVLAGTPGPFHVNACQGRLHDDRQALAVVFTDVVQADQDLDKLIAVTDLGEVKESEDGEQEPAAQPSVQQAAVKGKTVSGGWIVGENPHVLLFPFVKPGHQYRIQLSSALASAGGVKLTKEHSCELRSDPMSPSFFFASKGTVLPAGLNGGLPIVTVNVPEVDVEFLRVAPEKLSSFVDLVLGRQALPKDDGEEDEEEEEHDWDSGPREYKGQVGSYDMRKLEGIATSVYTNRFITGAQPNTRKVTLLPVEKIDELKDPGIYVAVMRRPGEFTGDYQVTYFYASDIGLHARRQIKGTDVFTTSLKTGKAQSGVDLEVIGADGKVLLRGTTDSTGHGALGALPDTARMLLAKRGKETSIIALREAGLDLSEFDVGGHLPRDAKLFAWSGRDLYRPGERFTLSVLARNADGGALPPMPIKADLKKPGGDVVTSTMWQPSAKTPGYLQHAIDLPPDAATGEWSVELRANPASKLADSVYRFKVEEFLPERMKLTLKSATTPLAAGGTFNIAVQGDYLYGAPAAGNRLLGSVAQERARNPLPKEWPGYFFGSADDEAKVKQRRDLDELELDENGKAELDAPYELSGASPLRVRTALSLLESGGRPVVRAIERMAWPARQLVGVRPAFDNDVAREGSMAEFDVIRVNQAGQFVPLAHAPFRLVRESREYYWRFDRHRGWHSGYTTADETINSGVLSLKEKARLTLPVEYGTYLLEITDPGTGLALRYRFYAGWGAQDAENIGNRPDRVRMQIEGAPVKPGEDIKVKILPPHDGEALVLVEADKVLWSKRVSVTTSGTSVTIPIDKTWNRSDMYVSTVVFRPGSQGDRVTPARAVGMSWLPLAREGRKLKVALSAPASVEPERRVSTKIKVDGAAGKKVLVTLSAVDTGILNITSFRSPDPSDFFFGKHRFSPELTDLYGKLIERLDGIVGKLKWGGDAGGLDKSKMPKKVKLVDLFSGPVYLDAKGEATIPLDLPDFNGTLRLMAVAATDDAFGSTDAEMTVAAPIVAEIAMPRFIGPGDTAALALDVTNMTKSAQDIAIRLSTDSMLRLADGERTVKLAPRQRGIVRFEVEAAAPHGLAKLHLEVKTAGARPVVIRREFALQVQPSVPRESEARRLRIEPGASAVVDLKGVERFYPGSTTASMTLSNTPPINIRSVVKGLLDYPYGCLEQTTSAAYPHVFIDEAGAKAVGLKPRTREERAKFIEGAISRIAGLQGAGGGFRLWSGSEGSYEAWLTPYVASFLVDARDAGFAVPTAIGERADKWMIESLNNAANGFGALPKPNAKGEYTTSEVEAVRLGHQRFAELAHVGYMLAREQKASLASLRLLHDQFRDRARSPLPLVHLGIALSLMGDAKRGDAAIADAFKRPYGIAGVDHFWLGDYGTAIRDTAMSYALLARHKIRHPQRENMLMDLNNQMGEKHYWYSTQERIALFMAARAAGAGSVDAWQAVIKDGDKHTELTAKAGEVRSLEHAAVLRGVTVENTGKAPLWVEIEASGLPQKRPAPSSEKILVDRTWYTTDGRPWQGGALKVGDMLIVHLKAKASVAIEDGLVVDHIPAGVEVENMNLSAGPQAAEFKVADLDMAEAMSDPRIKHREYRDDRFVAAVRLGDEPVNLFYMLRVVTPGRFQVPSTYAEDMYRPLVRGHGTAPEPITVVDPRGAK